MLSNELRKGDKIQLRNGWHAEIADNKKGNIRTAKVYGLYTEIGSIYVWDIASPQIELTPNQVKAQKLNQSFGF